MNKPDQTPHNLQDQLIEHVQNLLQERRKRSIPVPTERRGRNPQRKGFEEWPEVDTASRGDLL